LKRENKEISRVVLPADFEPFFCIFIAQSWYHFVVPLLATFGYFWLGWNPSPIKGIEREGPSIPSMAEESADAFSHSGQYCAILALTNSSKIGQENE